MFASFTPALDSMTTFFLKIMVIRYAFSEKQKKYVEILNTIWIIAFCIGILSIFGNFGANICLVHSSLWLSHLIFSWNDGRHICFFRKTQNLSKFRNMIKISEENYQNSKIWGKFGMSRQVLDKLRVQWIII